MKTFIRIYLTMLPLLIGCFDQTTSYPANRLVVNHSGFDVEAHIFSNTDFLNELFHFRLNSGDSILFLGSCLNGLEEGCKMEWTDDRAFASKIFFHDPSNDQPIKVDIDTMDYSIAGKFIFTIYSGGYERIIRDNTETYRYVITEEDYENAVEIGSD